LKGWRIVDDAQTERYKAECNLQLEKYKADCNVQLEKFKAECNAIRENFKLKFQATVQSGQAALKSAFLINGGAAVALLAFIGNVWTKIQANVTGLGFPLLLYVFGVLFPAVASGLTYLCQYQYAKSDEDNDHFARSARKINCVSIIFVILSYIFFAIASYLAYRCFVTCSPEIKKALCQ
jgi:hypothetical protein